MSLRFAIIGCGKIGKRHAAIIAKCYQLVACCDIDELKANDISNQYGAKAFNSIEALLSNADDIDIGVVCTPNGLHAFHSIMMLEKGWHVLCEKPMAISTDDCQKMIDASLKHQRYLWVVKQNRFNPPVQILSQLIKEGKLGKISSFVVNGFWNRKDDYYFNTWHVDKALDGGTLFTQFSHFIDLIVWLFGDAKSIKALTGNFKHQHVIPYEDAGHVLMQMENGTIGTFNYTVNAYQKNMEGSITVFGEKGTIKIGGAYLNELKYWEVEGMNMPALTITQPANDYGTYQGSMSNHDKVYDQIESVLNGKASPNPDMYAAMKTVALIEKIYQQV